MKAWILALALFGGTGRPSDGRADAGLAATNDSASTGFASNVDVDH